MSTNPTISTIKEETERKLLCEDTETQGGRGHTQTKVKMGVMLPQARNPWGPLEAVKGKKGYSPLGFGGSKDLLLLDFRLLAP